jgi:thiol:disulfide interchange protein DsbD
MALLGIFLLLAIAGWFLGRWPARRWAAVVAGLVVIAVVAVSVAAPKKLESPSLGLTAEDVKALSNLPSLRNGWQPWSAQAVKTYQSQGRPVLVDFTASWCLSCQVNERVALTQPEVEKALADGNVALLKADWTRGDDAITQTLASFGRSGVPAYALYVPGQSKPELLPEVLTPGIVMDAVARLPKAATASVVSASGSK